MSLPTSEKLLTFHPKWFVKPIPELNTTLVLGEGQNYRFDHDVLPWFPQLHHSHTKAHVMEWLAMLPTGQQLTHLRQINQFVRAELLWEGTRQGLKRLAITYSSVPAPRRTLFQSPSLQIEAFSALDFTLLSPWIALFKEFEAPNGYPTTFVIADDYLDPQLAEFLSHCPAWCLVRLTEKNIWLGPWSTPDRNLPFPPFQARLMKNQPTRDWLQQQFPEESIHEPVQKMPQHTFWPEAATYLKQLFNGPEMGIWEWRKKNTPTWHPVVAEETSPTAFAEQMQKPIQLHSRPITYSDDGGSRTQSPEETVAALRRFISPITGKITHLELHPQSPAPITIYNTGFHQTPKQVTSPKHLQFVQACMGKGVHDLQSQASGLCEALERHHAVYQGNEECTFLSPEKVPGRRYLYQELNDFSPSQYEYFAQALDKNKGDRQASRPYDQRPIHWSPTWSLTHQEQVYLPSSLCFLHTPFAEAQFGRWNSNGASAGNTVEEALIQGLYELIERDAVAIWWYNRISRPGIPLDIIPNAARQKLTAALDDCQDYWLLDLTHDLGVPVVAAIAQDKTSGAITFGFGCHLHLALASQRALSELCQLIPIRGQHMGTFNFDEVPWHPYLAPNLSAQVVPSSVKISEDLKTDLESLIAHFSSKHLEVIALDYSRKPVPISTVKVWIPGLCHIWPRLQTPRLYQVPVALGWLTEAKSETDLNETPLFV